MKKVLTLSLVCFFIMKMNAQVKIGYSLSNPHSSAILELDGGATRGLLLPRMRKIDMLAINPAAEGLTVYLTDEQATYLRRSNDWVKLIGAGDAFTLPYAGTFTEGVAPVLSLTNGSIAGTGIYGASALGAGTGVHGYANGFNSSGIRGTSIFGRGGYFNSRNSHALITDTGRVGLGTLSPTAFVEIDADRSDATSTVIINDDVDPRIQFRKGGVIKSYIKQEGNNLVLRPTDQNFTGKVILQAYNDGPSMFVDANGNSSFGQDPSTFNGTPDNVRVHIKGNGSEVLALEAPVGFNGPMMRFIEKTGNTINRLASIRADEDALRINHKKLKYEWGGNGNALSMVLKHDVGLFSVPELSVGGFIGVGTGFIFSPEAPLHIRDILGIENTLIIEATTPTLKFKTLNTDKAFIQQTGDDIKIGTYFTNTNGRFIVRTGGFDRLWVDNGGNVSIGGYAPPAGYKLAVKGKVAATDFDVVAAGSWPDYVFDSSYKIRSLEETEAFIKLNKHLPAIPAASVIEKDGYSINDMQKRMLETIEELTLHLIEADKQIKELTQKINKLTVKQ